MSTDWRALCEELISALADFKPLNNRELAALDRARAALAEPVGEGVTDEEIMELMPSQMHEDLAAAVRAMAEQEGIDSTPAKGVLRIMLNRHCVDLARAVLARYGHQPAPPADGEVGELVAWLRRQAAKWQAISREAGLTRSLMAEQFTSAADLLEQQHPAPVPVAERLPGPEDCDEEGRVWVSYERPDWKATIFWELATMDQAMKWAPVDSWLPATALPLPAGEVEP